MPKKEATRAEVEARRGIKRDENGRILRSKQWIKDRIVRLEGKIGDFKRRTKNASQEIKERKKQLNK